MKMNKMLMVLMTVVMVLVSAFAATAQEECQDCCGSDPCYGDDLNSTRLDVVDCIVEINDRIVKNDVTVLKAFDRGEDLEVEIEFVSLQDAEDVQVMAFLTGYHRGHKFVDDIFDITSTFDVDANVSYKKTLELSLPDDFKYADGDELKIRVQISDKYSAGYMREYNLQVEPQRDNVVIQDVILDPSTSVQSGRGLFASVRVKNMGEDTEDSLRIEVSLPALGLKATEYIDELEEGEATTSEDLFLRIPSCVEPGDYVVRAKVTFADGDEDIVKETSIVVTEDETCDLVNPQGSSSEKTVVTVPGRQDVVKGTTGTVYPVILQNNGATDRSYELTVSGVDSWATYRFDPGAFVLIRSGETKTVYLYVTPSEDAPAGEKVFMVSVETSNDSKQIALTANVIEGEEEKTQTFGDMDLTKALEIGVIVLVVLLIVLGLIVAFNKLKGNDEPEEVSGQTYY
ncbi:hypothetical protein HN789_05025 [archaeon]|nr:hypothetical protein [archaeon]MBT4460410.1 hypothetical protein [archaeon]MBT4859041.1 hypothetical protein [archaeon]MBT5423843.1 hypothetical protein [archaeon]MBT7440579.1 hypothetical protein [archaeon]